MPTTEQLQAVMTGTESNRVEELRRMLAYPIKQLDPEGSRFWFLRPGADKLEAADTLPIAVGFYPELNEATHQEIVKFLTSKEQPQEIYGHYISRRSPENQPVMYILLPSQERTGRITLILPTEGGLRQRQIQTFAWDEQELLGRFSRLEQGQLPIAIKALNLIPLVEWVFYEATRTAQELARELAKVTRCMEQAIPKVYEVEDADGYLHELFVSFQRELLPNLNLTSNNEKDYSFADIYAQTIAYGLFTARVFSYVKDERQGHDKETYFDREDAWQQLPETNPFLRHLFQGVSERSPEKLGEELITSISEIIGILRAAKMDAILSDFRQKMNREDIVIRFYEDFLAAYKPQMRERRGVYYTPEPVVSYMVRSVDELLKDKFNKPLGLADPEVMILDPACGTGTFLLWICQLIYQRFQESSDALIEGLADKSWSGYVKERLLPRIFGFELLMAPYAIAHLKLGLFLEETGYQFDAGERLGVYLTNTLDDGMKKSEVLFEEFITQEADRATEIKQNKPIMIVIGNPPYEGHSANKNLKWISNLIKGIAPDSTTKIANYFESDGILLKSQGERNLKWLNNDYVKFMRFAHWRIEKTGYGILAFITDRSYLGGPTFRGMRQSLMGSFDYLNILDLHGNVRGKRKDLLPFQIKNDENVFEISQGTAINIFVKSQNSQKTSQVYQAELWGKWEEYTDKSHPKVLENSKSAWLSKNHIITTNWSAIQPSSPFYLFEARNNVLRQDNNLYEAEYNCNLKITEIFKLQSMGITGGRDKSELSSQFSKDEMWKMLNDFVNIPVEEARKKYHLGKDSADWKVNLAQADVRDNGVDCKKILPILYRPFDTRFTYYTGRTKGFHCRPRNNVMKHLISYKNLALTFIRNSREGITSNFFVSNNITDKTVLSSSDNANLAPLYIYPDSETPTKLQESVRHNFSESFLREIIIKLGYTPTPESIFYYIYAILHSPIYRTRYTEFLKIDFPRVPLTSNNALFTQLAEYGEELVALHLMKSPKLNNLITKFEETTGNHLVDAGHPKFINQNEVVINKKGDKFTGVPEEVWNW
jgi:predicted helicase